MMTEKVDCVLINPGNPKSVYQHLSNEFSALEPPTFMALVANYLRGQGKSVVIFDIPASDKSIDEIAKDVIYLNPTLVGIFVYGYQPSASTQNMPSAYEIHNAIKHLNPNIKTMFSGTHPSALPRETMLDCMVDFVCDRDGFYTTDLLIDALQAGDDDYGKIPSLWHRDSKDTLFIYEPLKHETLPKRGLEELVTEPAWDLLPMDRYRSHSWQRLDDLSKRQPYASIYTSLNCSFSCSFCCIASVFGGPGYYMWEPEVIVNQIEKLVKEYGVYTIKIVDEMFLLNEKHVLAIANGLIERGLGKLINVWIYGRVDVTGKLDMRNGELLETLLKAGLKWVALGIESSSENVRDGADKVYTNDDITSIVRRIQSSGMNVMGNYIFGLPDDTHESMQQTLDMAIELNTEFVNMYSAVAYPGSQLHKEYSFKNGTQYQLPENVPNVGWIGYSQHAYETFPLHTDHLSNKEVLRFRDEAFLKYFTNEKYINMVREKFGTGAVLHIDRMVKLPRLKRKIFDDKKDDVQGTVHI